MTRAVTVPGDFDDRAVCVMGLGYVGITLATMMASVGFDVIGVEIREDVVRKLQSGDVHFFEPGLSEQVRRVIKTGQLTPCTAIPADCPATVYIITVGTPLDENGKVNLRIVQKVTRDIA